MIDLTSQMGSKLLRQLSPAAAAVSRIAGRASSHRCASWRVRLCFRLSTLLSLLLLFLLLLLLSLPLFSLLPAEATTSRLIN